MKRGLVPMVRDQQINEESTYEEPLRQPIGVSVCIHALMYSQVPYVANSGDNNVSGYRINPTTGALTPIAGSPFPAGGEPQSVAVDPSGTLAYVANFGDNTVSGYKINLLTGALTPIGSVEAGRSPNSVAVDPSGKF